MTIEEIFKFISIRTIEVVEKKGMSEKEIYNIQTNPLTFYEYYYEIKLSLIELNLAIIEYKYENKN